MRPIFAFLLLSSVVACSSLEAQTEMRTESTEEFVSRDFALSGFDGISLEAPSDVDVRIGDSFSVRAEARPALLDMLEFRVEDGVLVISCRDNVDYSHPRFRGGSRVFVTMPVVRKAAIAASGDMRVEAGEGDEFRAAIAGSGDLTVDTVTATRARFSIAGSGDLRAAGTARDIEASIAGSGDMALADLRAQTMRASIQGSGEIDAYVTGNVDASFAGSGQVRARGGAQCRSTSIGSGRLSCSR